MTNISIPVFPAPVRTIEGVSEYKLSNGLTVLLLPDQTAQNVTVCVTYLVGSRQEGRGEAGMAHLLEHLLFKGTPTFPNVKAVLQDRGAFYNASTWYDRTNYFETLAATDDNLEFAIKFEADRMVNSWIRQEDLDTEMTVVRNEFEMGENDPMQVLHDQMFAAAYQWHNYGKSTIGNRSDIERVSINNLKAFYEHYYQPDNAVLTIAGHFDIAQTQEWIMQYFGQLAKPSRLLDGTYTEEPTQDGVREVTLLRAGDITHAAVAYHIPAASHPDFAALIVLSEVLSNEPSGLLFQSLVQAGLASYAVTMAYPLKEPGMFLASACPHDQPAHVLEKMIQQLEHLNETNITADNVERAKARILKHIKMDIMNSHELALELSESIAQGDYRLFFYTRDQVKKITADDVIRVASNYFLESNRTTGLFIPTEELKRAMIPSAADVESLLSSYCSSEEIHLGEKFEATTENIDAHTIRSVLSGTIKTALLSKSTRGQVSRARLVFRFGNEKILQPRQAVLELIPRLIRRGTTKMSLQQVQDKLDKWQSTLKIYPAQPGVVVIDITSDRHHFHDVIILASELMQSPHFSQEKLNIILQRELTGLKKSRMDPIQIAMKELDRLRNPFPADSIHHVFTYDEMISELKKVTIEESQQIYQELYGANHLEVTIVGDCDPSILEVIENCFSQWHSSIPYNLITKPLIPLLAESRTIYTPDKQMATVALGANFSMRDDDIHYAAMRMANYIFGENMRSRLIERLREKEGLSYDAGSALDINRYDSAAGIVLYAMCPTAKADFTLEAMKEEYFNWIKHGVTEKELKECKQSFKSYFDNVLASDELVLQTLAAMIDVNRTFGYYTQMLNKMDQLQVEDIHKVLEIYLGNQPIASVKAGDF